MSQGSTVIADGSGAAVLAAINTALAALLTNNSGTSAPSSPQPQQFWVNTSATPWVLSIYDGAQWVVVGYINATTHIFTPVGSANPLVFNGLLVTNDASYPNTKIDISAGSIVVTDGTNYPTLFNVSAVINTAATGANGMDTSVLGATPGWVHNYVICNGSTVAGLGTLTSPLSGSPTMPAGYTQKRYVGSMYWNGTALVASTQKGIKVIYDAYQQVATGTTAQTWSTQNCASFIPPTSTRGYFQLYLNTGSSGSGYGALRKNGSTSTVGHLMGNVSYSFARYSTVNDWVDTDSSQTVQLYVSGTIASWALYVLGFELNI